jgi:hypothetical protein
VTERPFDRTWQARDGCRGLPDDRGDVSEGMLVVAVRDDTGSGSRGKQRLERGGIWYTAQSGIWQTVWAESADRLRRTLAAEQQRREQAVTAAAVAEQARILADQARAASLGETERLRGELAELTSALKIAHQQREEAVTAVAVAQALLREHESHRAPNRSEPEAPSDITTPAASES